MGVSNDVMGAIDDMSASNDVMSTAVKPWVPSPHLKSVHYMTPLLTQM